jgi:MarR family transcriptional regulator for hemolysin
VRGRRHGPGHHHRTALGRQRRHAINEETTTQRNISLKVTVIARQMRKLFDRDLEGWGVTRSQWTAVVVVARHAGATQRTIADALDMSEAAAGRLIDRLCTEGLLERRAKADDKRAYCVFLTDAARPILERLSALGLKHEERTFRGIDDSDLEKLSALLDKIYENVSG